MFRPKSQDQTSAKIIAYKKRHAIKNIVDFTLPYLVKTNSLSLYQSDKYKLDKKTRDDFTSALNTLVDTNKIEKLVAFFSDAREKLAAFLLNFIGDCLATTLTHTHAHPVIFNLHHHAWTRKRYWPHITSEKFYEAILQDVFHMTEKGFLSPKKKCAR